MVLFSQEGSQRFHPGKMVINRYILSRGYSMVSSDQKGNSLRGYSVVSSGQEDRI